MKKSYLMRRPADDDEENYCTRETVYAKPINVQHARSLGSTFQGKDFVKGSEKSHQDFYGTQSVVPGGNDAGPSTSTGFSPLSHDERNKISAKIIKAELKGDTALVQKLKHKLEQGVADLKQSNEGGQNLKRAEEEKTVILMTMDKRSGLVKPAHSNILPSLNKPGIKGTVETEYNRNMEINEMVSLEKLTTAHDQLTMFNRAANMCSDNRTEDDWVVDDNIISHPKKRYHEEKDKRRESCKKIKKHKTVERTLDSCRLCIESRHLAKHTIVAVGLKTYLAVIPWEGLSDDHCYIAPMGHYSSTVLLDEDVFDEIKLWYRGLVAMWKGIKAGEENSNKVEEEDCVFIENAKRVNEQGHMTIECVPLPKEIGDLAPIYFKKAIMDSEKEWSDNKKLIDLSQPGFQGSVRKAIPKGFPYFSVNFGLHPGYAHVIENDVLFPSNFAQEIIGGMLDLSHNTWRNVRQMSFDEVKQKRDRLREKWRPYDWTEKVKAAIASSDEKEE